MARKKGLFRHRIEISDNEVGFEPGLVYGQKSGVCGADQVSGLLFEIQVGRRDGTRSDNDEASVHDGSFFDGFRLLTFLDMISSVAA